MLYQSSPVIFCVTSWFVFLYVTQLLSFTVISWNGSQPISGAFLGGRVFFVLIYFLYFYLTSLFPVSSWSSLVFFSSPGKFILVSFLCRNTSLLYHVDMGRENMSCLLRAALPLLPSLITVSSQQQSPGGRNSDKTNSGTKLGFPALRFPTVSWVKWWVKHLTINDLWMSVCIKPVTPADVLHPDNHPQHLSQKILIYFISSPFPLNQKACLLQYVNIKKPSLSNNSIIHF